MDFSSRSNLKLYTPVSRSTSRIYQPKGFHIRLFRESDVDAIRYLFDVSFPLHYNYTFYDSLRAQFFKGSKLTTYVVEKLSDVWLWGVFHLGYS